MKDHVQVTHKNIYSALCAAQAEMGTVVKGAINPAFKSKYANLADVMSVVVPALTAHGIAVYHTMMRDEAHLVMRTVLHHGDSDTHIDCDVPLIVAKNDMQGMKSATTYAKRIGVESLTGIAPEDDDGNAAVASAPKADDPQNAATRNEGKAKVAAVEAEGVSHAIQAIKAADTLDAMAAIWADLPNVIKKSDLVLAAKDARKAQLSRADLADEIPY